MSKRFTDTNKWEQAWFRKLAPEMKCVWSFLCDRCDHAGIWEIDIESISFFIGKSLTLEQIKEAFQNKIQVISETKILIQAFVDFQYGNLNPDNRVHQSVLKRLEKLAPKKDLRRTLKGTKEEDKDKDKDKALDKDKDKEVISEIQKFWNDSTKLPKVLKLSDTRKRKLQSRLESPEFSENWKRVIVAINNTPFLYGENDRGWRADFDWFIENEENFLKVLEGKYQTSSAKKSHETHADRVFATARDQLRRIEMGEL